MAIFTCFTLYQGRKNNININFWSEFPADIPDPYARMPGVKEFLPITGAAGKPTFWCGHS